MDLIDSFADTNINLVKIPYSGIASWLLITHSFCENHRLIKLTLIPFFPHSSNSEFFYMKNIVI